MALTFSSSPLSPPFLFLRPIRNHPKFSISIRCCSSSPQPMDDPQTKKRVVVCGGGVIGVCTAYFLAKKGAVVTLVEKSSVACAASGKAGGFLALDWCDGGPVESLARASFNLHRSLSEELNGPESYGYRPLTALSFTITESGSSSPSGSKSSGNSKIPSWIDGSARGPRTIGTTQTTAQVHPQLFTRTLLNTAVEKYGAEVVIGKVDQVRVEEGRVGSVVLDGGRIIESESVVLALGPWTGKFDMFASMFRVYGLKAHSIVLQPKDPAIITPHALFLSYFPQVGKAMDPEVYPRPTGEVYICGMSSEEEVPDDPEQIVGNPASIAMLKRVAKNISSHLTEGEAGVKAEQACFLPCTNDSVPIIGEVPGVKGCYVATGHSCWGILNGPATGVAVAELVVDGRATIVDLSRFSPARFVGLRKVNV
ncbi:putative LRR receptor-like serine/threonine-protein kinase [Hibiscus syriacus]|uniref:LRR receptor-like serine/threonine-protein kinase n=1 Tax=Hibiscus syriacus TaxID=106335 RepID=A0A6A2WB35_HIBSY|nr:putative oxidoreductase TDA3 [Hibiscus syriacus]KAE8655162.1 putative LRR receptor-like serine/threonine-protein kinase [Hibiscus syriacus]